MNTRDLAPVLAGLFAELTAGTPSTGGFVLNSGDQGLLASLEALTAEEASCSAHGGATIAAHTAHLSYGLSLMNRWAEEGGDPFTHARWQDAWTITGVEVERWDAIRAQLRQEVEHWQQALHVPREVMPIELSGMVGSVAHLAYHLGAIRQIVSKARGPRDPSEQ
ncbi:MAG: hypothetical protein ACO1NQ_06580 [Flavobacteriales bacterium]